MIGRHAVKLALLLSALSAFAAATDPEKTIWKDEKGNPAPNTESRSSKNGFGGWLVVTPDADWKQKWETSPDTVPKFATSNTVQRGNRLTILIFFSNPQMDEENNVDITCDIDVIRPDGTSSIHEKDLVCFRGKIGGNPSNVRLSAPTLQFIGESKDPAGEWIVKVMLKDNRRNVALPLKTSFTLQ
jgi:hypothetical protein